MTKSFHWWRNFLFLLTSAKIYVGYLTKAMTLSINNIYQGVSLVQISVSYHEWNLKFQGAGRTPPPPSCFGYTERQAARKVKVCGILVNIQYLQYFLPVRFCFGQGHWIINKSCPSQKFVRSKFLKCNSIFLRFFAKHLVSLFKTLCYI